MKNTFRTSNNVFRNQVQNYIIENLDQHSGYGIQPALVDTVEAFNNWYNSYWQKQEPSKHQAFQEFLKCLPSQLSVEFSSYDISKRLELWFTNCDQQYIEKPNYQDHFFHFIADNFFRLCKKYNVQA